MQNLWKRDPAELSGMYVDLFGDVRANLSANVERTGEKCNAFADRLRGLGNNLFGQKQWCAAMEQYNRCLRYAEPGTESMSIALGNRAACFSRLGQFAHCLADIDAAIEAGYPERLRAKLDKSRADCVKQLESGRAAAPPATVTLSYAAHANMPAIAEVLEFRLMGDAGRGIVAAVDIPVGQTVVVAPKYISETIAGDLSHCGMCQNVKCHLMPCIECSAIMFCSDECRNMSRACHEKECGYSIVDRENHLLHVLAGSVFIALHACDDNVEEWMALVEDVRRAPLDIPTSMRPKDKYRWFLQLKGNTDRAETIQIHIKFQAVVASMAYDVVMALPATACLFDTLAKQRFLMHVIAMHFGNIVHNISIQNMFDPSEPMTFCLMASMFNHRCYPNVMHTVRSWTSDSVYGQRRHAALNNTSGVGCIQP